MSSCKSNNISSIHGKAPVVIVHGMWSTPAALIDLRRFFEAQGHQVHTPRLPYHYDKCEMTHARQVGLAKSGIRTYVAAIKKVLTGLEEEPILVGHSMGGLIAQLVAAEVSCSALVLLSTAPPAGINAWTWSVLKTFGHNLLKFPLWKKLTDLRMANIRYGIANTQTAKIKRQIFELSTFESGLASFQLSAWFLFKHAPTKVDVEAIKCPVLMLSGTEDKITPIIQQRKIARRFAHRADFYELEGVCHWTLGGHGLPQIEQHISEWLALRVSSSTTSQAA